MQSVRSSARELENANALGEAILSSIHGQRERLKVFSLLLAHAEKCTLLMLIGG